MKKLRSRRYAALLALGCALLPGPARALAGQDEGSPTLVLLSRARTLEQRGRLDLAQQDWAQVLTMDPNDPQALAGMVRAARAQGKSAEATQYLSRLRAAHPKDAELARLEGSDRSADRDREVAEAEKLLTSGNSRAAFAIYRRLYGLTPPSGAPALAYFQAEAGIEDDRPQAIAGLRALSDRYPSDSRYAVLLGKVLLQSPRTQAEGRTLLERYPGNVEANAALRAKEQTFGQTGPAARAPSVNGTSLPAKPSPATPLQAEIHVAPRSTAANRGAIPTAAGAPRSTTNVDHHPGIIVQDQTAYLALNQHRTSEAEVLFQSVLAQSPTDTRALAGLGYVYMLEGDPKGAVLYFEKAQESGDRSLALTRALVNGQFALTLQKASSARQLGDIQGAEAQYRAALQERPADADALEGLAGLLLQTGRLDEAIPVFAKLTQVRPMNPAAWRGLVIAQASAGKAQGALATDAHVPADARVPLQQDASYQQALRTARDQSPAQVARVESPRPAPTNLVAAPPRNTSISASQTAIAGPVLPPVRTFGAPQPSKPNSPPPTPVQGQEASSAPRPSQTSSAAPVATVAGPVSGQGTSGGRAAQPRSSSAAARASARSKPQSESAAPIVVTSAPTPTPPTSSNDASDVAARAVAAERNTQGNAALQHGQPERAISLYRDALRQQPTFADASRGLVEALYRAGRNNEAIAVLETFPSTLRLVLAQDATFQETSGDVFLATDHPEQALHAYATAQSIFAAQKLAPPLNLLLGITRLLAARDDDANLYRELIYLDSRRDLDDRQRREVQLVWTGWAVHRARVLSAAGDQARAVVVLNAAAEAFAGNPQVFFAVANGYVGVGLPKEAVALYKQRDLSTAAAPDLENAIRAGVAAHNFKIAEMWARIGRERFPKDPSMLVTLGELEQAKGHENQAMELSRQARSLAPVQNPGQVLTAELLNAGAGHGWRVDTPGQLSALLSAKEASDASSRLGNDRPFLPGISNVNTSQESATSVPLLSGFDEPSR